MKDNASIIIVGVNRGGTSAIAASLNSIGIFMGEFWHEPIYEDLHLARYFRDKNWHEFRSRVKKYENEQSLFAWKLPDSINSLKKIDKLFTNPKYIFVFRDIYAISHRKKDSIGTPLLKGMLSSSLKYLKALYFIRSKKPSCMLVSYEKLLSDKDRFAYELLYFLEIEASEEKISFIKEAISSSSYREWAKISKDVHLLEKSGFSGHLDHLDKKKVTGWAKSINGDNPVTLEIFINDKKAGEVIADVYRKDLVDLAVSKTGSNGFIFHFNDNIDLFDEVSVRPKGIEINLIGSPKTLQ